VAWVAGHFGGQDSRLAKREKHWRRRDEKEQFRAEPLSPQISLTDEARKVAETEGVALNQFINIAVAEKLSALRTESYLVERTARAVTPEALRILSRAG
jgi:hypothetical protein